MNKKVLLAVLIFILVIGVVFFIRLNNYSYEDNSEQNQEGNQSPSTVDQATSNPGETPSSNKISLTALSEHNSVSDCWISYKGKVYDITSYLPRHPGSADAISPYCGSATEFENAFTKKHGTSKVSLLMKVGTFIGDFDVVGEL